MAMHTSRDDSFRDYDAQLEPEEHPTLQNKAFDNITTEIRSTVDHLLQLYLKRFHMYMSHVKFDAALRDAHAMYDISDVISLLHQHHSTLEEISIIASIDETAIDEKDMNISFPQLKSLHLQGACTQSPHMFNWILEHAPNLRSLGLVTPCTAIADPVSNHITTLNMTIVDDMHYQFLDRLVNHHINLGQHSCLKHLSLTFRRNVSGNEAVIQNIGDLVQLDTLSIDMDDVGYNNAFNIMRQKFVSRDHLFSSLSWKGDGDTLTHPLQYIQRMNHIKDLTLGKLSESDVLRVSFCNPQRSLTVECVHKIPNQALDMLRERFKKIRLSIESMN